MTNTIPVSIKDIKPNDVVIDSESNLFIVTSIEVGLELYRVDLKGISSDRLWTIADYESRCLTVSIQS